MKMNRRKKDLSGVSEWKDTDTERKTNAGDSKRVKRKYKYWDGEREEEQQEIIMKIWSAGQSARKIWQRFIGIYDDVKTN